MFRIVFRIVFRIFFAFFKPSSYRIKNVSGAVSFYRRAALICFPLPPPEKKKKNNFLTPGQSQDNPYTMLRFSGCFLFPNRGDKVEQRRCSSRNDPVCCAFNQKTREGCRSFQDPFRGSSRTCKRGRKKGVPLICSGLFQKIFRYLWRFYSLLFRGFFVVFPWLFRGPLLSRKTVSGPFSWAPARAQLVRHPPLD